VTACTAKHATVDSKSNPKGGTAVRSQSAGSSGTGTHGTGSSGTGSIQPATHWRSDPCMEGESESLHNTKYPTPLPDGIQVDWVLRCRMVAEPGRSMYQQFERSDDDPAALLDALRAPDEPLDVSHCRLTLMAIQVPYFLLVLPDGTPVVPRIPVNHCQVVQAAVLKALNSMHFVAISGKQLP
jgi:hypothetical protein